MRVGGSRSLASRRAESAEYGTHVIFDAYGVLRRLGGLLGRGQPAQLLTARVQSGTPGRPGQRPTVAWLAAVRGSRLSDAVITERHDTELAVVIAGRAQVFGGLAALAATARQPASASCSSARPKGCIATPPTRSRPGRGLRRRPREARMRAASGQQDCHAA
jgi:hypothetical protein